jgi:hypothetical protein
MTRLILTVAATLSLSGTALANEPTSPQKMGDDVQQACELAKASHKCQATRSFFKWLEKTYPGLDSERVKSGEGPTLEAVKQILPKIKTRDDFNSNITIECACGDEALVLYAIKLKFYKEQLNKS